MEEGATDESTEDIEDPLITEPPLTFMPFNILEARAMVLVWANPAGIL